MMKRILIPLLLALVVSSCAVYAPKTADIPHFEQQGDLQASLAFDASTGVALSAAGAVSNHIGAMVSGAFAPDADQPQYSVRPAAGYYYAFPCHLTLGAYAGAELASNLYHTEVTPSAGEPYTITRSYQTTSLFGQFDLLWAPAPWVDLGYRVTAGNFHYDNLIIRTNGSPDEQVAGNSLLIEQTLQVRLGGPHLKALLSASYAQIPQFPSAGDFYYRPFTFGLGLTYRFNPFRL